MLSDEDRKRIEEEEKVRAEAREKYNQPPKKKTSLLTWLFLIFFIGLVIAVSLGSTSSDDANKPAEAQSRTLSGRISADRYGINIYNDEKEKWQDCHIRLNVYWKAFADLDPGKNSISYDDLVKDGSERFNWYATKPTDVSVQCGTPKCSLSGAF